MCETQMHVCVEAHSFAPHVSFMCVTCLIHTCAWTRLVYVCGISQSYVLCREAGGWGRVPFSRNLMSPTPRRKWYLTTGRRAH